MSTESGKKRRKGTTKVKSAPVEESGVTPGTSSAARAAKLGSVSLRGGFILGFGGEFGVEGMYYQNEDLQFGLMVAQTSQDLKDAIEPDDPTVKLNELKISGSLYQFQARYFVGDSFHVSGGVAIRSINASIVIAESTTSSSLSLDVTSTSYCAQLAIGNTWSWDSGVFIGADWIGYVSPLAASSSSSTKTTGPISVAQEEFADLGQDFAEDLGRLGNAQALVLNIGFAF